MVLATVAALAGSGSLALEWRTFRAPYPGAGRAFAWMLGQPEQAYNFDVVVPGQIYRSGRPDARFVRYLRDQRGVARIVSLSGPTEAHETARELGMEVTELDWPASHLPPRGELESLVASLGAGGPVLIHCSGGSDRTGYTVATWRVLKEGWSLDRAVAEMSRYWHDPAGDPRLHRELVEHLRGAPVAAGPPVRTGSR